MKSLRPGLHTASGGVLSLLQFLQVSRPGAFSCAGITLLLGTSLYQVRRKGSKVSLKRNLTLNPLHIRR